MRSFAASMCIALAGCAGARSGAAEARGAYYVDNSGVSVKTLAARVDQPISNVVGVTLRATMEQIVLEREPLDPGDPGAEQSTGHPPHDPDAVTSASSTAGGGAVAREWRVEGVAEVEARRGGTAPLSARGAVRASAEPDYTSIHAGASGSAELASRNTMVTGFFGAGADRVDPVEAPPGEADAWPATHRRVTGGATIGQIVSPVLTIGAGVGVSHQWGRLENPYRRALVRTTLFPERVPDRRTRATAFVSLAWYLGDGTALHLRQGAYADSWEVFAAIPEVALAREWGDRALVLARYRLYAQWPASFFRARYHDLDRWLTGDVRLGPMTEHNVGCEARFAVGGAIELSGHYDLSLIDYEEYATDWIVGHIVSVGFAARY